MRLLLLGVASITALATSNEVHGVGHLATLIVVADRRDAAAVAARIAERLSEPFRLLDHELHQAASIGIADEAADADRLLRHADIAMYAAKARGKAQTARFDAGLSPVPMGPS